MERQVVMDKFLEAMDRMAALSAQARHAPALDSAAVMARIMDGELLADDGRTTLPFGVIVSIGASALAAAAVVAVMALPAWHDLIHPLANQAQLPDILSFIRL